MDTTTFTYQVLWQGSVDFGDTAGSTAKVITLSIPGFDPANCVFMIIPTRLQDVQSAEADGLGNSKSYPYVTTAKDQVVIRSANPSANLGNTAQTRVVAKGYAVRFKT
ncbi:Uncharacterized protein AC509_0215 [Pseudomonas amygdali pv. morsprunorum]|nr:Uncharacterized protein AC509_0215 [Pseudomonas amygdali pv. morsprunorum]